QRRFRVNRVCIVADRGMISAETIVELEARGLIYVLGVRERTDKIVQQVVLDDPAPFVPFVVMKPRSEVDYEAKAVTLASRRYIVCRNSIRCHGTQNIAHRSAPFLPHSLAKAT